MSLGIITMTISSKKVLSKKVLICLNFSCFFDGIGIGISFKNICYEKVSVSVSKKIWYKKVSVSVSKKFGIEKSIGIGFKNFWYLKKVSVSVSKFFGIEKYFLVINWFC